MKITVFGPAAGYGPDGRIHSWAPNESVEIDDKDKKAVAWARSLCATPLAELVEDTASAKAQEEKPAEKAAKA